MQHLAGTHLLLKTKARSRRQIKSAETPLRPGFYRLQPSRSIPWEKYRRINRLEGVASTCRMHPTNQELKNGRTEFIPVVIGLWGNLVAKAKTGRFDRDFAFARKSLGWLFRFVISRSALARGVRPATRKLLCFLGGPRCFLVSSHFLLRQPHLFQ